MKFSAKLINGELRLPLLAINNFARKEKDGQMFVVEISKLMQKKSDKQLGYFHKIIIPVFENGLRDAGYRLPIAKTKRVEYVKNFIKTQFGFVEKFENKKTYWIPKSLSKISKKDLSELIDMCIEFALDNFGIIIEKPNRSRK